MSADDPCVVADIDDQSDDDQSGSARIVNSPDHLDVDPPSAAVSDAEADDTHTATDVVDSPMDEPADVIESAIRSLMEDDEPDSDAADTSSHNPDLPDRDQPIPDPLTRRPIARPLLPTSASTTERVDDAITSKHVTSCDTVASRLL